MRVRGFVLGNKPSMRAWAVKGDQIQYSSLGKQIGKTLLTRSQRRNTMNG